MKRALLVGVNNYRDPQIQDLGGCVNDVLNVRAILKEHFKFEDAGIHVLTDERATCANIRDRLHQLVYASKDGDATVFHFSGHGSQIRDRSGDELTDQLDELICPHDMDWNRRETFLIDDDLSSIFEEGGWSLSSNQAMEVILDCCHSGTGLRGMMGLCARRPAIGGHVNRYTPPPIDILCRSMDAGELPIERLFLKNMHLSEPVLWSGCRANQTCADAFIEGKYNGAFTFHLCNLIRKGFTERFGLIEAVRKALQNNDFDQVPQLETEREGKLTSTIFS